MSNKISNNNSQELEDLINESENDAKNYKKKLLTLGINFLLVGFISFITVQVAIKFAGVNRHSFGFIALCITLGLVGFIGGIFRIYKYIKLQKKEEK